MVDPLLLNQASLAMTEILASCLALVAMEALAGWTVRPTARRALLTGMALGVATLCRPTFVVWAALICLHQVVIQRGAWRAWLQAGLVVVGVCVGIDAVDGQECGSVRKADVCNFPRWIHVAAGKQRFFYDHLTGQGERQIWDARNLLPELDRIGVREDSSCGDYELRNDRLCYDLAAETIRARPTDFLRASLLRIVRL